tara:strand:- start:968 stop:1756 length:789 start_codon:yes stop_codon:yes gene_type:complete
MTKKNLQSSLFSNIVTHERFFPFKNSFKYSVTSICLKYNEAQLLDKKIKFFSYNKFNIFSFYDVDHGYRDKRKIDEFVKDVLFNNSIEYKKLSFQILCFPRILGYVFNPISVIYCYDSDKLIAILYEVKNTSNEQHTYCFADTKFIEKNTYQHNCKKFFYVSPFIEMNCYYNFTIKKPLKNLFLLIEQFNMKNEKILIASQIGKKVEFKSFEILLSFLKNPLMTFKVIFAIHFQALKIIFKGGKYYPRKKKPLDTISFEGKL